MINKFPTIESVLNYSKPLYIVQQLTFITIDGAKLFILYIQDMHTFQIIHHEVFEHHIKSEHAGLCICNFLKSLEDSTNITLSFLKSTPFNTQLFIQVMVALKVETSYYNRLEALNIYTIHKFLLKEHMIAKPNQIPQIIITYNHLTLNRKGVVMNNEDTLT